MHSADHPPTGHPPTGNPADKPLTLAIDVGGTGLKATVLDTAGRMVVPRSWLATPHPCPPARLLASLAELVAKLPAADRVSIGFPGIVRDGRVLTAPHFDTELWRGFPLESRLADQFGKPTRLLNDAEVQGLGVVAGHGIELVLTLGTGAGSALFRDGMLAPHLELAHHPITKHKTYNDFVGHDALNQIGVKRWNRRVRRVIDILYTLVLPDILYIGGGNAVHIAGALPSWVKLVPNDAGLTGGLALWTHSDQALGRKPPE
jgi:polyphosphate glucokinase